MEKESMKQKAPEKKFNSKKIVDDVKKLLEANTRLVYDPSHPTRYVETLRNSNEYDLIADVLDLLRSVDYKSAAENALCIDKILIQVDNWAVLIDEYRIIYQVIIQLLVGSDRGEFWFKDTIEQLRRRTDAGYDEDLDKLVKGLLGILSPEKEQPPA